MSESEEFPPISENEFNKRAFKRRYKNKYEEFIYKCKISKSKDQESLYRRDIREIMALVSDTLKKPITYQIGNVYYILGLLERYLDFMNKMSKRVENVQSTMLRLAFDAINEESEKLKQDLKENLQSPIPSSELRKASEEHNESGRI